MKIICKYIIIVFFLSGHAFNGYAQDNEEAVKEELQTVSQLFGLEFTSEEIELMLESDRWDAGDYEKMREQSLENAIPPALFFNPIPQQFEYETVALPFQMSKPVHTSLPDDLNKLAFYSVRDLAYLIETKQISSMELTQLYLDRLKQYGPKLECVITLTEDLALKQAAQADAEIASGTYRGPLHGIPYGAKDLLAVKGYNTTWGAKPFEDQMIDQNAAVIENLNEAGAVLVAKLTLGALAMGDIWYGGTTRNPWNLKEGSSGSSAGSAAATAAGLVAFAIGSETNGSIVSPSIRCGVTGLRPTFGRVSRTGAMTLSWSMDKLGPICRYVEDCAIVLNAIHGTDESDPTTVDVPFNYTSDIDLKYIKIGYLESSIYGKKYANQTFDQETIIKLKALGAQLEPVTFPEMDISPMYLILSAEAAAAFDELTRSGRDDLLVNQSKWAWPNNFRRARMIPAVEYIQANRIRTLLIEQMYEIIQPYDAIIAPPFQGNSLLLTNLTGHPSVAVPNGFKDNGSPTGITFIGQLYGEARLLAVAKAYQDATGIHLKHPDLEP